MINLFRVPSRFLIILMMGLHGCTTLDTVGFPAFGDTTSGLIDDASLKHYSEDQISSMAKLNFTQRNYGHAQKLFQRAVELRPSNGEYWLGLAASYDHIRRFELADRAYRQAAKLIGDRPEFYNNVGYSFLLRGNLVKARDNFLKAYELDPDNPTITNNLELLRHSMSRPGQG